ncbi:MAG TPA: hypothetical protein VMT37_01925 [Solirubrobacterales bacterium]|nr:hypothetical protein [Solirubrobacterales bacterium]
MEGRERARSEFKVVLDGFKLSEKDEQSISAAIQGVVAGHLADLDFEGDARAGILELAGGGGTQGGKWLLADAAKLEELQKSFEG